jgi:hypothetical protein
MAFVESLQIEMPDAFPAESYSTFMDAAGAVLLEKKDNSWTEFAGASNLIGWRFRASYEYMQAYLASWNELGVDVSFDKICSRERDLFGMFACGVSCIESATYALYALASHSSTLGLRFGDEEQRRATPRSLAAALAAAPSAVGLKGLLERVSASDDWHLLGRAP